jgi:uncharacterized membrane protein
VITSFFTALAAFVVLDGIWLGVLMKHFYRTQLAPIARMSDGGLAPIWPVAALVYVLLAAGIAVFVVPRADSVIGATAAGALFGLVVYGVYDLTNYSTLAAWPAAVTVADILWGTTVCAMAGAASRAVLGHA